MKLFPRSRWITFSAGLLFLAGNWALAQRADTPRSESKDGMSLESAEPLESLPGFAISPREPWNEFRVIKTEIPESEGGVSALGDRVSVFVHFVPRMDRTERPKIRTFAAKYGAFVQYEYDVLPNVINIRNLPRAAVAALKLLPGVERVEDDYVVTIQHNDSMPLIRAYQSQIQGAGITADGTGVRVCVIDTGIDSNSIMYAGRIDAAAGWDFVNNDANPEDDNGHGSHVSGTVLGGFVTADFACAATGPESMQGVAPNATLIGVKVLNAAGSGSASNIIAGINRCASTTLPGGQADVINMSLGGGQFTSTCDTDTMAQAANNAVNAGVVVVAAAGNNGFANSLSTPACGSNVIAVAAIYDDNYPNCDFPTQTSFGFCLNQTCTSSCTDNNPVVNQRCCFSNRSSKIDVAAPGCIIFSNDSTVAAGNGLVGFCGTSQASPHVAGLAALLLDVNPSLTPAQVRQHIRNGAVDLGTAGFDTSFGYGRIDVINSLQLANPGCTTDPQCSDGLFCNGSEVCAAGTCQAGTPPNCADSVACTTDSCNEATDSCDHTPNNGACSDGLFCNGSEVCNVALGCQAGTPPNCADSVACTDDSCNEATDSCDHAPNNSLCGDGLFCNGAETCSVTLGCQAGSDPCPGQDCDEAGDVCVACTVNAQCDDGVFCNGAEICSGGTCQTGLAPNCDDGITCTTDSCNESTDACDHAPNNAACNDGLFCNGTETCSVTLGCQAGTDPCAGQQCNESNDTCGGEEIWMTFTTSTSVPGVGTVQDEDIVAYDTGSGTWSLIFDGSDVGLSSFTIDGLAVLPDGSILISTSAAGNLAGLTGGPSGTSIDDSDIVRFIPTSLGSTTAGSWVFYFDGSDVGLTTDAEDIDAISLTSDGRLVISTLDAFSVTGLSGNDEDLIVFNATSLGSVTAGSFGMYFDGSDVGLSTNTNEDVDAAAITADGTILLSTLGSFSVTGASGADEDIFEFTPTSLGTTTSGTFTLVLDLSTLGIATSENVNAIEVVP